MVLREQWLISYYHRCERLEQTAPAVTALDRRDMRVLVEAFRATDEIQSVG